MVPQNATVRINYSVYVEHEDTPFDSTVLRDQPYQFRLNEEPKDVILGLDISVSTMKRKELSYFLVKPKYGYGAMGVPPRIPKNAVLLYKVELLDIIDDIAAAKYKNMDVSEREKLTFEQVCKACRSERESGNHMFGLNLFKKAENCYRRASKMLEEFHLQDDVQERSQQELLLKCYLNLAMCALKLNKAPLTITNCNLVLEIDHRNTKALFRKATAYMMLQEFDKAVKFLKIAKNIEPHNEEILSELTAISKKKAEAHYLEQAMCEKMFLSGGEKDEKNAEAKKEITVKVNKEFEEYLARNLNEIKQSTASGPLTLPANLTSQEHAFAVYVAKEIGLKVTTAKADGRLVTKITK